VCRSASAASTIRKKVRIDDHVWTSERVAWFEIADDLPRFPRSCAAVPSKALEP
jgi:hypothetical protein